MHLLEKLYRSSVIRLNEAIFFVGVDAAVRPLEKTGGLLFCQLTVNNIYCYILDTPRKYLTILLLVLTAFFNVIVKIMHILSATI